MTYRAWDLKTLDRAAVRELTHAIAEQRTEELEYSAMDEEPWSEQKYAATLAAQQKETALLAGILAARGITDPADALTLLAGEEECMMIYWKLESPSGVAELYERKKDYNLVQNQENIFQENKEFLLSLKESEWRQKTLEERTIAAQKMVRLETERLGIPEIPLYVKETGSSNCVALYNNEENEIWYAPEHLTSQTAEEFFTGICEECYHGMEYYLLERMDWNSEMANTAYFEEMRKWKLNDNRYISGRDEGDSFEAYQSQPLEASAKKYASSETEALIHFIAVYGDE